MDGILSALGEITFSYLAEVPKACDCQQLFDTLKLCFAIPRYRR